MGRTKEIKEFQKCDLAWENRAYVHIKFDHFWTLKFHNFVPKHNLFIKLLQQVEYTIKKFNVIYKTHIAYTDSEICEIMGRMYFVHISPIFSWWVTNIHSQSLSSHIPHAMIRYKMHTKNFLILKQNFV